MPTKAHNWINRVTIERDTVTITIEECEAHFSEVVSALFDACLGLGFSPVTVKEGWDTPL